MWGAGGGPPGPRSARGNALLSLPTFVSALPRDENQRYSEDPAGPGSPEGTPGSPRVQKRLLRIPTADIEHGIEVICLYPLAVHCPFTYITYIRDIVEDTCASHASL